ncbi:hypothetical protein HDE77_002716 [Rhodanobacter sp. MP7CTX1]|nr:hypothetical protein [Rhodanobacter sp. MP7CTX1]
MDNQKWRHFSTRRLAATERQSQSRVCRLCLFIGHGVSVPSRP